MLVVAVAFALVFLFRDLQILSLAERPPLVSRLAAYAVLLAAGVAIFGRLGVWTHPRFARGAIVVQILELICALLLRRRTREWRGWIGFILPAPAFLMAIYALGSQLQNTLPHLSSSDSVEIVTGAWLLTVAVLAAILRRLDNPWEDRKFAGDFAMMAGCTAVVFVPFVLR